MADKQLDDDQAAVYDRQLRVWGVEVQQKCVHERARARRAEELLAQLPSARSTERAPASSFSPLANTHSHKHRLNAVRVLIVGFNKTAAEVW